MLTNWLNACIQRWQPRAARVALLQDLASLLSAGASIKTAVQLLQATPDAFTQHVARHLHTALSQGQSLADGLAPWLPSSLTAMLRAGEQTQTLDTALLQVAQALQQQHHTWRHWLAQLAYPLIVLLLALTLLIVILHTVLIPFEQLKPRSAWPAAGLQLYTLAKGVQTHGLLGLTACLLLLLGSSAWLRSYTGTGRATMDRWPAVQWYRQSHSARVLQTLGILLQHGLPIKSALTLLQQDSAPYLHWHLSRMQQALRQGHDNIADILNTGLLDPHTLYRLQILSRSRDWSRVMLQLGEQTEQAVQHALRRAGKFTHAGLLLLTASIAATILLGIYAVGSSLAIP